MYKNYIEEISGCTHSILSHPVECFQKKVKTIEFNPNFPKNRVIHPFHGTATSIHSWPPFDFGSVVAWPCSFLRSHPPHSATIHFVPSLTPHSAVALTWQILDLRKSEGWNMKQHKHQKCWPTKGETRQQICRQFFGSTKFQLSAPACCDAGGSGTHCFSWSIKRSWDKERFRH